MNELTPGGPMSMIMAGGLWTWLTMLSALPLLIALILVLIIGKTRRGPVCVLAFSLAPVLWGMCGLIGGMISFLRESATQLPAVNAHDLTAGFYVGAMSLLVGGLVGGMMVFLSLIAIAIKTPRPQKPLYESVEGE